MPAEYPIPATTVVVETEVKKSRFITYLAPASSRQQALAFIESIRLKYPDARHHCTAFIAGPPEGNTAIACDDDGEPSGTAGKLMLNVLMHKGMGEIVAVVVRYFGGIKLGAGGLVRAYSGAVQAACDQLPLTVKAVLKKGRIICNYALEQQVRHYLDQFQASMLDCAYTEKVIFTLSISEEQSIAFAREMSEASRGAIQIIWEDDEI